MGRRRRNFLQVYRRKQNWAIKPNKKKGIVTIVTIPTGTQPEVYYLVSYLDKKIIIATQIREIMYRQ